MKKILFLLLICVLKLNAYEYLLYENLNAGDDANKYFMYVDQSGRLLIRRVRGDGSVFIYNNQFYPLASIRKSSMNWINNEVFQSFYINDLKFLNDLYTQSTQAFLNYLYNPDSSFNNQNHINYENYQILYNEDGLAVESIVGGVWKGLYDTPENSGWLYDKQNNILYDNGNVASLFDRFWYALTGNVSKTLKIYYISMLGLNVFILIVAVYLVKVILGLIIKWISTVINNTKVNVNLGAQKRW